ncbi:hypothetical protein [Stenotrophomonas sp. ZAC14D2_NAIMI4_6]|uniref:hypothetical protein n=1 Tax=Stenotrophomonas sp. ZAC14D2_NAIMI4_6 TaxID=2072406 RepID=UPI00131F1021|nr:hypothetical protein [Stenotrophomonas sp. ZAC14D2_NAIMI4_6]
MCDLLRGIRVSSGRSYASAMEWTNWLTLGIAVLGATLGVFNAVWLIRKDTVRLKVSYVSVYIPGADIWSGGVQIINAGYLPVTVTEIAFHDGKTDKKRAAVFSDYVQQVKLPHRMEPRTAITVVADPGILRGVQGGQFTWCSTGTACGMRVYAKVKRKKG